MIYADSLRTIRLLYYITLYYIALYYIISYYITLRFVVLRSVVLFCVVLCYIMSTLFATDLPTYLDLLKDLVETHAVPKSLNENIVYLFGCYVCKRLYFNNFHAVSSFLQNNCRLKGKQSGENRINMIFLNLFLNFEA